MARWSWTGSRTSFTSTLSTLTPHGSVASSKAAFMTADIVSLSDKISDSFFVPKTFRSVVAASKRVEWLKENYNLVTSRGWVNLPEIINTTKGQLSCDHVEIHHGIYSHSYRVTGQDLPRKYKKHRLHRKLLWEMRCYLLRGNVKWDRPHIHTPEMIHARDYKEYTRALKWEMETYRWIS